MAIVVGWIGGLIYSSERAVRAYNAGAIKKRINIAKKKFGDINTR